MKYIVNKKVQMGQAYQDSGKIQDLDDPAALNAGMMFTRGTSAASE